MEIDFNVIIRLTSVRLGVSEEVCREAIMFHWENVNDILSNVSYSKVKIKGFANFEVRKNFLKKQEGKLLSKLNYLRVAVEKNPSKKNLALLAGTEDKYNQFLEIYSKYWKDETNQTDPGGMDELLPGQD
jgi:hypothetical protein